MSISDLARRSLRVLSAAALLTASTFAGQRAEALSPVSPGISAAVNTTAGGLTIEVRGHGGGSGGRGAGGIGGGRGVGAAVAVGGGAVGAGVALAGAPRFAGQAFVHRRHVRGVFIGGVYYDDYPYDDYPDYYDNPPIYPVFVAGGGCHRVMTVHGPRVVCHRAARHHRLYRRHGHRRHHRA